MRKNERLYHLEVDSEIFREIEQQNLENISYLLIEDVSINDEDNICLKFASRKFYSKKYRGDSHKIFYGSREKDLMPCVRATEENIERIREILLNQVLSFAEYNESKKERELFKNSFYKIGLPSYLLVLITAGIIANPLISISFISLATALSFISYKIETDTITKIKFETPYSKFNTISNEYKRKQEQEREAEEEVFNKDWDNVQKILEERLKEESNSKNKVKVKRM